MHPSPPRAAVHIYIIYIYIYIYIWRSRSSRRELADMAIRLYGLSCSDEGLRFLELDCLLRVRSAVRFTSGNTVDSRYVC